MGSGMMQCWINGPATSGIDDKIKMVNILLKNQYSIVPPFHYSIGFRICFEFLISNFEFPDKQESKNSKACLVPACPG